MILSICSEPKVLEVMRIINIFITIIKIAVPILLIFTLMFKFTKATINDDKDNLQNVLKTAPKNMIAAVLIFLIPNLVSIVVRISFPENDYSNCLTVKTVEEVNAAYEEKIDKMIENLKNTLNVNSYNNILNYLDKIKDENKKEEYKNQLDEIYEKIKETLKIKIASINIIDTVVNVKIDQGAGNVAGYYFSSINKKPDVDGYDWISSESADFKTVKFPGTYYVFAKDKNGYVTDGEKVVVPEIFDVTFLHQGKSLMETTFSSYLPRHGSSVDELNEKIAAYNKRHGLRTRESVVVGAMAFISEVQSLGFYLPYSGSNDAISKERWGVNKYWGGKGKTFLACDPYVVWSYKNAGLNIYADRGKMRRYTPLTQVNKDGSSQVYKPYNSPSYKNEIRIFYFFVGVVGSTKEIGDNIKPVEQGLPGDVLQNGFMSGHEMMIVDKYDDNMDGVSDGYIVLQSRDIGLCYEKRPYSAVILYDMSNVFNNTAGFADLLLGWQSYYIPESDYPSYLR